ncbi:MAG: aminotransferase class I/II-fold pyridoxal phosphate-dependent enzyme [Planctomycetota bacterium]|nr:MAG: aminotransferase class I/II-fold pyridoxal phosphate-dependent enzyme [Planctomycetota bacterium]
MIDLRSDTVTQPSTEMRRAMAEAEVADDVLGTDPTADRLQQAVADLLGKEAALLVPSGTMANQIAVKLHCQPGDELVCEAGCHIYNYEQGGFAQLSGVAARPLEGRYGVLRAEQFHDTIRPDNEHFVRTRLVAIENTHNRGGGTIQPLEQVDAICQWAHQHGLATHLDGARLPHATAATGIELHRWCQGFDTVSICFSKGLGAPIGSALAGTRQAIARARRIRKLLGGGMRQVGIIAAAALHALQHHRQRLVEDHQHAQMLAQTIADIDTLELDPPPQTNIVVFRVSPELGTAAQFVQRLAAEQVACLAFGPQHVRMVTHLDVDRAAIERARQAIQRAATRRT